MSKVNEATAPVLVELADGVAWVTLNRPEKRNAMNPALNAMMVETLNTLEENDEVRVVVITGAGESFSAGMDLKEYFRDSDGKPSTARYRTYRAAGEWQWRRLRHFAKPTIAMVNGWCFGGAFTPMIACDLAIAAEEAVFGLSEINWGIIPAGNVTKAVRSVLNHRDGLYYVMTGKTFTGVKAAAMGLVNEAVPLADLRAHTRDLAATLVGMNPVVLRQAKTAFKNVGDMDWEVADDYLMAKQEQGRFQDPERGREQGMRQFLDDKTYKPGLGAYTAKG
ncbi:trans-feruloyl-CoA hydratase/vanillin synthase [Sphingomonas vulcanisoli]|uniref:Trans-feruloyl-CoA hydratase/vanillin synthase n=1 Tax=Sphingomonas vulcanisoli TaxID=1658060 RepID=A0ABX0TXW5_9SPHN|nr:p-hydroxycinnamoyl CoA hydratase/lyase [Sphingomonas vulcanisoli]NIJ08486.1 trans-feruloyl-CoA hydratase/vanillin synthase [Sphingomonas vulcanisoli]